MAPKTVSLISTDPDKVTALDKLLGGLSIGLFVAVWLSSLSSPFLFVYSVVYQQHVAATVIVLLTVIAYLPWKKGPMLDGGRQVLEFYAGKYLHKFEIAFEGDNVPSPDDPQTFYAVHPHGAFSIGWALLFCHAPMQHVRFCFSPILYASPFFRLMGRCTGLPGSADKATMISYMKNGEHLALPPGGFEEATLTCTEQDRVFIKKRTGFIRLCLKHGIAVRPVFVFGERSVYWNLQGNWKMRLAVNRYGIPAIVPWGSTFLPILPKTNHSMRTVVGAPLKLPKLENPTKEDVTHWHQKYMAKLEKLYEEHKEITYGPEEAKTSKLEFW